MNEKVYFKGQKNSLLLSFLRLVLKSFSKESLKALLIIEVSVRKFKYSVVLLEVLYFFNQRTVKYRNLKRLKNEEIINYFGNFTFFA